MNEKPLRIHIVQHCDFEPPGWISNWAQERGHYWTVVRPDRGQLLPKTERSDLLILLGGPISANDDRRLPWLLNEKTQLAEFIENEKRVLGICLGGQLIANVLGASVHSMANSEIGWQDVHFSSVSGPGSGYFSDMPRSLTTFHWHGEMFALPKDATALAHSACTPVQAFSYKSHILAMQFHLETTLENVGLILEACDRDLKPGSPFVQSAAEIRRLGEKQCLAQRERMFEVLDQMTEGRQRRSR